MSFTDTFYELKREEYAIMETVNPDDTDFNFNLDYVVEFVYTGGLTGILKFDV